MATMILLLVTVSLPLIFYGLSDAHDRWLWPNWLWGGLLLFWIPAAYLVLLLGSAYFLQKDLWLAMRRAQLVLAIGWAPDSSPLQGVIVLNRSLRRDALICVWLEFVRETKQLNAARFPEVWRETVARGERLQTRFERGQTQFPIRLKNPHFQGGVPKHAHVRVRASVLPPLLSQLGFASAFLDTVFQIPNENSRENPSQT